MTKLHENQVERAILQVRFTTPLPPTRCLFFGRIEPPSTHLLTCGWVLQVNVLNDTPVRLVRGWRADYEKGSGGSSGSGNGSRGSSGSEKDDERMWYRYDGLYVVRNYVDESSSSSSSSSDDSKLRILRRFGALRIPAHAAAALRASAAPEAGGGAQAHPAIHLVPHVPPSAPVGVALQRGLVAEVGPEAGRLPIQGLRTRGR